MKYIRTKDGIINTTKYDIKEDNCILWYKSKYRKIWKSLGTYIKYTKQADIIEELCDAVVRVKNDRLPLSFNMPTGATYKWVNNYLKMMMEDKDIIEIYGAIWTDKGLIYVAKMNKKGEMELL